MRTIRKGKEPGSLVRYRKTHGAIYEDMPQDTKQDIRDQLVEEQRGLCCYCQSRIRAGWDTMKIEHRHPQSAEECSSGEGPLDYTNMLGACLGGYKHGEKSSPDSYHCDTAKGDARLCFNVCDTTRPIESRIHFSGTGEIKSVDPSIHRDINNILRLNHPRLVANRKAVLRAFQQRIDDSRRVFDPARELPKWDGSQPGELEPFAQVIVHWLNKKLTRTAR